LNSNNFLFPYVEYIDDTKNKTYWEDKLGNYRMFDYGYNNKLVNSYIYFNGGIQLLNIIHDYKKKRL
jgi:hypothetical protein